jgi:hypothetical protein
VIVQLKLQYSQAKASEKKGKKFDAIVDGKKTVSFGTKHMTDMTTHKDPESKQQ